MAEFDPELQKLVDACDYDTKLAVTAWVISHIDDHGNGGGSFRYLIYNRLNFGPDAYVPLYEAGGMNITNELDYDAMSNIAEVMREEKIESAKLKGLVGLCDEPGCFDFISCGTPTDDGYRSTCSKHAPNRVSSGP
jgi:hypothetical protein